MDADNFRVVFDLATAPDRWLTDLWPMLALPAIGLVLVITPQRLLDRIPGFRPKGIAGKIVAIVFFVFSSLIIGAVTYDHFQQKRTALALENAGMLHTVSGCLQGFHPMPASGHDSERIAVDGRQFSYSDFDESTPGFNNTTSHGGPIQADSAVHIAYSENTIVKLAVSDHACPAAPDLPR